MGHTTIRNLPSSKKWRQVVDLVKLGADSSQVASATITAAERGLKLAGKDPGLIETVWLLTQIPSAARSGHFVDNLRKLGLDVGDSPGFMDIVGAFSDALDVRIAGRNGKTDLGEMAQMAAAETISYVVGGGLPDLLEVSPADVRKEFQKLRARPQIVIFARRFFARLAQKTMDYFLSRAFAHHVGEGKRFATLAQKAKFAKELEIHCTKAAQVVGDFAGEWIARIGREKGAVSKDDIASFIQPAMVMLTASLKEGTLLHGD